MLHRNLLAYTYDFEKFQEVLEAVEQKYLGALEQLHTFLWEKLLSHERS